MEDVPAPATGGSGGQNVTNPTLTDPTLTNTSEPLNIDVGNPIQLDSNATNVSSDTSDSNADIDANKIEEPTPSTESNNESVEQETKPQENENKQVVNSKVKWKGGGSPSSKNLPHMKKINSLNNQLQKQAKINIFNTFSSVSLVDEMKKAHAKDANDSVVNKSPQSTGTQVNKNPQSTGAQTDYDINKAVQYVNENKLPGFGAGSCSPYVPRAINAGFGGKEVVPSGPNTKLAGSAYGPSLLKAGFVIVPITNLADYTPVKGDIVVMEGPPGGKTCNTGIGGICGHIQMYNGKKWVSDFEQTRAFWPGQSYEDAKPKFTIYRWGGN